MKRSVDQNVVDFVAEFMTDEVEVFNEEGPQPGYPTPPPPPGKRKEPGVAGTPPPPPRKRKRHPLPKPNYPGSPADKAAKARQKRNEEQKAAEKLGRNRSPFGDSLMRDLDAMLT